MRGVQCTLLSSSGYILGGVARLPGGNVEFIENTTRALRRLAGCDPQNDPESPPPPFSGGQCPSRYDVTHRLNGNGVPGPLAVSSLVGPIGGISVRPQPTDFNTKNAIIQAGGRHTGGFGNPCGTVTEIGAKGYVGTTRTFAPGTTVTAEIVSIEVCPNDPNNCGNPPPVFPPAAPININIDVTYNTEQGDEITVTIPFIFAPVITDITGNFRFPFTFDFGGIEFSGDFSLAPEFTVNINPPPAPRGTDSPITDLPAPDDEIPVAPSTFRERVVGVVVQARLVGEQQLTTIATTNIPQILAPRAGSIKFGYAIAGRSFWSDDIDIKDLNTFIPCPFSQGADTVAATPAPGVVLNYVPVFGAPLATVADLGSTPEP